MRVGLVSCAAGKLDHAAEAQRLYVSPLFRAASSYARATYDGWFILSARHGLLQPTDMVHPYDVTLVGLPWAEREAWGRMVREQLAELHLLDADLCVHAGRHYREPLEGLGLRMVVPLAGLGIGQQLAWYRARGS